jgi:benzoyl-CoA 2,3-dioxygenase component B
MFTDRDGKYQLGSLAESAFDPLSRTCRFMLTEEAHHLSVGELGLERIMRRSVQLEKQSGDARKGGGIDLATIQKWINYWYCYSLDLFGSEISSNAAEFFAAGIKGRWAEAKDYTEHSALNQFHTMAIVKDGRLAEQDVPLRNAMNEVLRQSYMKDCERVMKRWNAALEDEGSSFRLALPSSRFFRRQGIYADAHFSPAGELISAAEFQRHLADWLPTDEDRAYVQSLMQPVTEPGKMANWIAAPRKGINGNDVDYEYVRLA